MKNIIVAYDKNRGIGKSNELLWEMGELPRDMAHFRELTLRRTVIMGRKTLESIGRALPGRRNIVITSGDAIFSDVEVATSLGNAYEMTNNEAEVFIIGGGQIYAQAINDADRIYATELDATLDAEVFFPPIDSSWSEISREHHLADDKNIYNLDFVVYERETTS